MITLSENPIDARAFRAHADGAAVLRLSLFSDRVIAEAPREFHPFLTGFFNKCNIDKFDLSAFKELLFDEYFKPLQGYNLIAETYTVFRGNANLLDSSAVYITGDEPRETLLSFDKGMNFRAFGVISEGRVVSLAVATLCEDKKVATVTIETAAPYRCHGFAADCLSALSCSLADDGVLTDYCARVGNIASEKTALSVGLLPVGKYYILRGKRSYGI